MINVVKAGLGSFTPPGVDTAPQAIMGTHN